MERGKLVVIMGMAGAGKSSLMRYLKEHFPEWLYLRQPPREWHRDERVRRLIDEGPCDSFTERDEIAVSLEARLRQQRELITPALEKGRHVVLHRYVYCLAAYYYATNRNLVPEIEAAFSEYVVPDLVVYLDLAAEESVRRIAGRKKAYPRRMADVEFGRAVREYSLRGVKGTRFLRVDADCWRTPGELLEAVVDGLYGGGGVLGAGDAARILGLWGRYWEGDEAGRVRGG